MIYPSSPVEIALEILLSNLDGTPKTSGVTGTVNVYRYNGATKTSVLSATALTGDGTGWYRYIWTSPLVVDDVYTAEYAVTDGDSVAAKFAENFTVGVPSLSQIVSGIYDGDTTSHTTPNSPAVLWKSAGSAGDPWTPVWTMGDGSTHTPMELVTQLYNPPAITQVIALPAPPAEASACRVVGYSHRAGYLESPSVHVYFYLTPDTPMKTSTIVIERTVEAWFVDGVLSDGSGNAWVDLERNDHITPSGSKWLISCPEAGFENVSFSLTTSTFDLSTLIT